MQHDLDRLSRISAEDLAVRDVHRDKELIDCGWGWFADACPWCRQETDNFRNFYDVCDGEDHAILICSECGREHVVKQNDGDTYFACAVMSAADLRYLRWRKERGLPGSYWELTP